MGIIISGVRLIKPAYDFLLATAPKIYTNALQNHMTEFISDSFETLKPLTYEYKPVCEAKYDWGEQQLCIGEWLRMKSKHQELGSLIHSPGEVFKCIRSFGDTLKLHVRKPIEKDFGELVDLTKQLQPYDELLVKSEIPETTVSEYNHPASWRLEEGVVTVTSMVLNAIGVRTSHPWEIILYQQGEEEPEVRGLTDEAKAGLFEDIISYIVDLFKRADVEVTKVREHNEKIMEKMRNIVDPWKITNQLKK